MYYKIPKKQLKKVTQKQVKMLIDMQHNVNSLTDKLVSKFPLKRIEDENDAFAQAVKDYIESISEHIIGPQYDLLSEIVGVEMSFYNDLKPLRQDAQRPVVEFV